MLNKVESKIMRFLYYTSQEKQAILISPTDILQNIDLREFTEERLDKIINDLAFDGYFDLVYSNRHGERIYCITFLEKGKAFKRDEKVFKRSILFRVVLSGVLAVFSFLVGLLLRAIFKS